VLVVFLPLHVLFSNKDPCLAPYCLTSTDLIAPTGIFDHYFSDDTQEYYYFHLLQHLQFYQQLTFSCLLASIMEPNKCFLNNAKTIGRKN
jgi:hypothetical protein